MKIAIFSRPGDCFPNIISKGLKEMIQKQGFEVEILHEIPFLMRALPLIEQPIRWEANFGFRIREKIKYFFHDFLLKKKLAKKDVIIISECFANLFWRNYLYIEVIRNITNAKIVSYTDGPLDSAPLHKKRWLNNYDRDEGFFDFNLFLTDKIERKVPLKKNQYKIGVNLCISEEIIKSIVDNKFKILLDFEQIGFESERTFQKMFLLSQNILFTQLLGQYTNAQIRKIYSEHNILFLSSPETFGLSIGEALCLGCKIAIPDRNWVISWDIYDELPYFFIIYNSENLYEILEKEKNVSKEERLRVIKDFKSLYPDFIFGNDKNLEIFLHHLSKSLKKL